METIALKYIDLNRTTLADHASAQIFFAWCEISIRQGADAEEILYNVMTYNIRGTV